MKRTFLVVSVLVGLVACEPDDSARSVPDAGCTGAECTDAPERPDSSPDDSGEHDAPDADDAGAVCDPGARVCDGRLAWRACLEDGTGFGEATECGRRQECVEGACVDLEPCRAGERTCLDATTVRMCRADGAGFEDVPCEIGDVCIEGLCSDPGCDPDEKSYLGCDFWAVDLDNEDAAAMRPAVISVSNTREREARIELRDMATGATYTETVPGGRVRSFTLGDLSLNDTSRSMRSMHVRSNVPVSVHQFNPRNNLFQVYSNDASLLLPSVALGTEYVVLAWPTEVLEDGASLKGFVTIVATDDDTRVEVVPSAPVAAGDGVGAMDAGVSTEVVLARGEVLSLTTTASHGADLSGTAIFASRPVAVFAGSECANVPNGTRWCDHLEEQLAPVSTWGDELVAAPFAPRGTEPGVWRVIAARDGTVLSTAPLIEELDGIGLSAGEWVEYTGTAAFVLRANAPIAAVQYMVGSEIGADGLSCTRAGGISDCLIDVAERCEGITAIGDPAMVLAVPTSQFRDNYLVQVPEEYAVDYVTVVARAGTRITIDGVVLDDGEAVAIGDSVWEFRHVEVRSGIRSLTGSGPFGVTVHGYDCNVSYAYPGGLNLGERAATR